MKPEALSVYDDLILFMLRAVCGLALWFAFLFGMAGFLIFCGVRPEELREWALRLADLVNRLLERLGQQLGDVLAKILRQQPPPAA